jgi:transcriptional regulator GlxA family with amidase domain
VRSTRATSISWPNGSGSGPVICHEHLDASPLQVALSLRVRRAKRLLDGTDLPIRLVAERAGFSSTRRLSAAFARLYGRSPSALRKRASGLGES